MIWPPILRGNQAMGRFLSVARGLKRLSYIERQPDHHRKMSYQDEPRELFQRHGLEFDEAHLRD